MNKEINKDNAICERCGLVMNIPKSYARLCYDCSQLKEIIERLDYIKLLRRDKK